MDISIKGIPGPMLALVLASCAELPSIQPLNDHGFPVQANGFFVMPPQGSNWQFSKGDSEVRFYKILDVPQPGKELSSAEPHTFIISIDTTRADRQDIATEESLMRYAGRFVTTLSPERRQQLIEHKTTPYTTQGTDCVRYEARVEEQPRRLLLNIQGAGFVCRHPHAGGYVVRGAYSDRQVRSSVTQPSDEALREAEVIIKSVIFTPMK